MNQTEPETKNETAAMPPEAEEVGPAGDLAAQLAQAQAQAAEYLDNWRRAVAELSNARKRMQREQAEFSVNATARVLEKLLPIVDDVDRALAALPAAQADGESTTPIDVWVQGVRLILRKLQTLLESEGVTPIVVTPGQTFDPAQHHAISHEETAGLGEGQIIAEAARGYKLGDKVLRPAMVRVAKGNG